MNEGVSKLEGQSVGPMTTSRSPGRGCSPDLVLVIEGVPKLNTVIPILAI